MVEVRSIERPARDEPAASRKRICIVTSEFVGVWKNGGIGTAMSGLAELLARAGHHVTVLYTRGHFLTAAQCRTWTKRLARHGITFVPTRPRDFRGQPRQSLGLGFVIPAVVAKFLREQSFDIVHLNDTGGQGYLVAAARRFGVGFANTHVVTGLHGPTRWTTVLNAASTSPLLQVVEEAEQVTISCSEVVWSPSRYLVGWMAANGFRLPPTILLQQYVLPSTLLGGSGPASGPADGPPQPGPIKRLVFFGRLEKRKGLGLFLDVLDRDQHRIAAAGIEVVFLGRIGRLGDERADVAIRRRGAHWAFAWRIESTLGQAESVAFLRSAGSLAVIASPEDNSPCTVYEAIEHKIPFIAAATGGIPEIIHPDDRARVTFGYDESSLRGRLDEAIGDIGVLPVRPAIAQAENAERWLAFHAVPDRWATARPDSPGRCPGIVAIVLAAERPSDTSATVDGLRGLGPDLKATVVVGGDGSGRVGDGVLRIAPDHLGQALSRITAEHPDAAVVFLHAGVTCAAEPLRRMVGHLRAGEVDGLIPASTTTRRKIIEPLPFSPRLRGLVDPMATGLIAFRAAAVATGLDALGNDGLGPLPGGISALAAAAALRILPYPDVVAALPDRRLARMGAPSRSGVGAMAERPRAGREQEIRRLATSALCSPLGGAVPYTVSVVGALNEVARSLASIRRSRRRSAPPS